MQALAMESFLDHLSTYELIEHWLAVQESFLHDASQLPVGSVRVVELETLVDSPEETLRSLCEWVAVVDCEDSELWEAWKEDLDPTPNEKYSYRYRERLEEAPGREQHRRILADL